MTRTEDDFYVHGEGPDQDLPEDPEDIDELLESDDIVPLPDSFEIHEWEIMERFASSLDNNQHSHELDRAIRGRGAFRMFKETIHRLGIADQWYKFRENALKQIAISWCREFKIEFEE